jgi:hypothetical protein
MDHDSVSGAQEFLSAGQILCLPTTIGCEIRASFAGTPLEGRRINNPDQDSIAYLALHGVPHTEIAALDAFLQPLRQARGIRNRRMLANLNALLAPADIALDYDRDVLPLSLAAEGGGVTERHLLFALAKELLRRFAAPEALLQFLRGPLRLPVSAKVEAMLLDPANPWRAYDLLGLLKSELVDQFYVEATEECPPVAEVVAFAREHGIILAYAYLGDVADSVTGDKKPQKFEDDYLETCLTCNETSVYTGCYLHAIPQQREQIERCAIYRKTSVFSITAKISITRRQPFVCEAMRDPCSAISTMRPGL